MRVVGYSSLNERGRHNIVHRNHHNGGVSWMLTLLVCVLMKSNIVVRASISTIVPSGKENCYTIITPSDSVSIIRYEIQLIHFCLRKLIDPSLLI